jgi:hypothetical protein
MKKRFLMFVFALAGVLSLSAGVEAQARREFSVTVPFDFVAVGKTMPAGTYTVSRASQSGLSGLILSSYDRKVSIVVLPTEFISSVDGVVRVGFEQIGDDRFLKNVVTDTGTYNLPIDHSIAAVARVKHQPDLSASGAR